MLWRHNMKGIKKAIMCDFIVGIGCMYNSKCLGKNSLLIFFHVSSPELHMKGGNSLQAKGLRAAVQLCLWETEETCSKTSLVVMRFFTRVMFLKCTHVSNDMLKFGVKTTCATCNRCLSDLRRGDHRATESILNAYYWLWLEVIQAEMSLPGWFKLSH